MKPDVVPTIEGVPSLVMEANFSGFHSIVDMHSKCPFWQGAQLYKLFSHDVINSIAQIYCEPCVIIHICAFIQAHGITCCLLYVNGELLTNIIGHALDSTLTVFLVRDISEMR